jgi:hypothetical protein
MVRKRWAAPADDFAAHFKRETAKYAKVTKDAGMKINQPGFHLHQQRASL